MAYIQVTSDNSRPVGPLGIKKAEQDLIRRRYKQTYNMNDLPVGPPGANNPHLQRNNGIARLSNVYGNREQTRIYAANS